MQAVFTLLAAVLAGFLVGRYIQSVPRWMLGFRKAGQAGATVFVAAAAVRAVRRAYWNSKGALRDQIAVLMYVAVMLGWCFATVLLAHVTSWGRGMTLLAVAPIVKEIVVSLSWYLSWRRFR